MCDEPNTESVVVSIRSGHSNDLPVYKPPQLQRNPKWRNPSTEPKEKRSELQFEMELDDSE